jgi:hypothetical protein
MKTRIALILAIILGWGSAAHADLVMSFDEVFKHPRLLMDERQIYIWDNILKKIYIYSRSDSALKEVIGGHGGGPGEFQHLSSVFIHEDNIYAGTYPRLSIFSKNGKLRKNIKGPTDAYSFLPFGDCYVGRKDKYQRRNKRTIRVVFPLYDSRLNKIRDIFETEVRKSSYYTQPKRETLWARPHVKPVAYKDKLFIGSPEKRFFFAVFNQKGDKIHEIDRPFQKIKITPQRQQQYIDDIVKRATTAWWQAIKRRTTITFPDYFPAYADFFIENDNLYVFTYPIGPNFDLLTLDLNGNLKSKQSFTNDNAAYRIKFLDGHFHNGNYYYLHDNPNTETWQLHTLPLTTSQTPTFQSLLKILKQAFEPYKE